MDHPARVFDMAALRHAELSFLHRLEQEPGDTAARMGLAWCLVVQASFEAGYEDTLDRLRPSEEGAARAAERDRERLPTGGVTGLRTSGALLKSSLRQAILVSHLSTNPKERGGSEWLQSLIRLSGGEQALREAEAEAEATLRAMAGAAAAAALPEPPVSGRFPRRRRRCPPRADGAG